MKPLRFLLSAALMGLSSHLLDVAGGHMQHDANHHTEAWTFLVQGKQINAHFDLQRTK
jgi:hypothetical protein